MKMFWLMNLAQQKPLSMVNSSILSIPDAERFAGCRIWTNGRGFVHNLSALMEFSIWKKLTRCLIHCARVKGVNLAALSFAIHGGGLQ